MFTLIAAMDKNRLIGCHNELPWHLPADLRHFKACTLGKPVLMGRKTCESLPFALPGRQNLVLTRNPDFSRSGFECIDARRAMEWPADEIMVIGGATIYRQFLPLASRLLITHIDHEFNGDTWFPAWETDEWQEVSRIRNPADEKNPWAFDFVEYRRLSDAQSEPTGQCHASGLKQRGGA